MIQMYRSFLGTEKIQEIESGCWIHCVQPDSEEVNILQEEYNVPQDVIQDILDNDERPRYEVDDDWSMIILRGQNDAVQRHSRRVHVRRLHRHHLQRTQQRIASGTALGISQRQPTCL